MFARFSYDQAFSFVPGGAPGLAESNAFGSNENLINHARNIGLGWNHVFSPTTLNQATLGYDRIFDYIASQGNFTCESAILGIPNADLGCSSSGTPAPAAHYSEGLVSTEVHGGYWSLGDRGYSPFQGGTNIFSFKDVLDLIRGKHEIRAGLDLRDNQMNVGTEAFRTASGSSAPSETSAAKACPRQSRGRPCSHGDRRRGHPRPDLRSAPITGRRWKIYRPFRRG